MATKIKNGKAWTTKEEFEFLLNVRDKNFGEARRKFLEDAAKNPAAAIKWGDTVLHAQFVYEAYQYVERVFSHVGSDHGDSQGWITYDDALEAAIERLEADLYMSIGSGESTSRLANAEHLARQGALKTAVEELKPLVKNRD